MKDIIKKILKYFYKSFMTLLFIKDSQNLSEYDVLIISNGMSMSGAPLVLQEVVKYFKNNGYNPIIFYEHSGVLENKSQCRAECCYFFERLIQRIIYKKNFDYIFINTIASYKWINFFEKKGINYNLWVHEGREYFDKYQNKLLKNISFGKVFYVSGISKKCLDNFFILNKTVELIYPFNYNHVITNYEFNEENKKILLVGSICDRKNQIELLDAIKNLCLTNEFNHQIEVVFIGTSIEKNYYNNFLTKLNCFDNVTLIEHMNHDDLMDYYRNVYLCACTSKDDPMPVAVTESIFNKRLVLISSNTGQYQFVKKYGCGFTYQQGNLNELQSVLKEALNLNKKEYMCYVEKAYDKLSELFTNEKFCSILESELIKNKKRGNQ